MKTKKNPKTKPRRKKLPGESSYTTSASLAIDAHYEHLDIKKRWNKERVDRLCGFLKINYGELSSLVHESHKCFLRKIYSTSTFDGPLALLLTILENKYLGRYTKDTINNLFKF